MPGERLIGMHLLQFAHHALAHRVELAPVGIQQPGAEDVAAGLTCLHRHVHPATFLGVQRVAHDQSETGGQGLLAGAAVPRVIPPLADELLHAALVAGTGGGVGSGVRCTDQVGAQRGGFLQIAHPARAADVGQGFGGVARRNGHELAHETVLRQDETPHLPGATVDPRKAPRLREDGIAVVGATGGAGQVDARHAASGQALQLAGIADAVLVQVAPQAHVGKAGIERAEHVVVVAVQRLERRKPVRGLAAVGQQGLVAEQLCKSFRPCARAKVVLYNIDFSRNKLNKAI